MSALISFGADSNGKGGARGWVGVEVPLNGHLIFREPCSLQIFTLGRSRLQRQH